jgi:uncharacterized protein (TIGR02996 family)
VTLTFATAGDVLLREVLERPADDSPRLILADWLDERGDEARAEFIRVQCELSRGTPAWRALRRRERELLGGVGRRVLDELRSTGWWPWTLFPGDAGCPDGPRVTFRRGFVDEVRLPCRQFLRQGVPAALFGSQPITRVELSDRAARESGPGAGPQYYFCRVPPYCGAAGHDLPAALWDRLSGGSSYGGQMIYRARGQAEEVLSAACVRLGRDAAGLPPLEG